MYWARKPRSTKASIYRPAVTTEAYITRALNGISHAVGSAELRMMIAEMGWTSTSREPGTVVASAVSRMARNPRSGIRRFTDGRGRNTYGAVARIQSKVDSALKGTNYWRRPFGTRP